MLDDIIYKGLSSTGNLRTSSPRGGYQHLLRGLNDLTLTAGRELMSDTSHLVVTLSWALPFLDR